MRAPIDNFSIGLFPKGSITQFFGENPKLYASLGLKSHNGLDIVAPHGSPLYAVEAGTVVEVKDTPEGYGRHLRFITVSRNGVCNEWTYGHCDKIFVKQGDKVTAGQHIANMGNTGFVVSGATPFWKTNPFAGTHLHLGLRTVKKTANGWSYPGSSIKIEVLNYNNGFKGSVDPLPLLEKVDQVEEYRQQQLSIISLLNQVIALYTQLKALK
jgi:murein DD-endopeptidase MepM/ murein hydrolase activator NlpD